MKSFYLNPIDGRKSFYNKAVVIESTEDGVTVSRLKSYNTIVAEYYHEKNKMVVRGWFSATTARHINSFLKFYGFDSCTKKQLQNYK